MMPSASENTTSLRSSSGAYSPSSNSTVPVRENRLVRSYSARRSSRLSAKSPSILALSTTTIEGSSSSVLRTISDTSPSRPSWFDGPRKSPIWMYSTADPRDSGLKKANSARCRTILLCGSDIVV